MIIAYSVPVFFLLIGVEVLLAGRPFRQEKRTKSIRFQDAITDLSCGIGSQVTGIFMSGFFFALYIGLYELAHVVELDPKSIWVWLGAGLLIDHQYYWWHRASHRINFIWAAHVVHHQSEDYNLAVALRQAWFTRLTSNLFYLPLAVIGVPPFVYAVSVSINTLYQFWIHTRLVKRLGPLEWFLNTPSHHRVHHGIDPEYVDKNYAGVLIIWDRLFGTFTRERQEPTYGTVARLESWNPVWANFRTWVDLVRVAAATRRVADKLKIFFAPPEWMPDDLGGTKTVPVVDKDTYRKFEHRPHVGTNIYIGVQFVVVTVTLVSMLLEAKTESWWVLGAMGTHVIAATWLWGAMFEHRTFVRTAELARLVLVPTTAWALSLVGLVDATAAIALSVYTLLSGVAFVAIRTPTSSMEAPA